MEFSFSDKPEKSDAPVTKVYSPKKGGNAGASGGTRARSQRRPGTGAADEQGRSEPAPVTVVSRIGIMFSAFLFSGMVLFTLTGYERIARAYADINAINSAIESTKLRIKALDVQIECAVTIQDAQMTAETYGMRYPAQSQFVRIGSSIPISGSAPSDNGPGGTVLPEEPSADTEPEAAPGD